MLCIFSFPEKMHKKFWSVVNFKTSEYFYVNFLARSCFTTLLAKH